MILHPYIKNLEKKCNYIQIDPTEVDKENKINNIEFIPSTNEESEQFSTKINEELNLRGKYIRGNLRCRVSLLKKLMKIEKYHLLLNEAIEGKKKNKSEDNILIDVE